MTWIIFFVGWTGAALFGWRLRQHTMIDYKKRWETATDALQSAIDNGIVEKRVEVEKKIVHELPPGVEDPNIEKIRAQLRRMGSYQRQQAEESRLDAGLPPIDDLQGLGSYQYQEMVALRFEFGYDELGRKFDKEMS